MRKKILLFVLIILVGCWFISSRDDSVLSSSKIIKYNGNNLRVSIDGQTSNTLPTEGKYYLVDYVCKSTNTNISWDMNTYELSVSNGRKSSGVSCYLSFSSNPKLSEMKVGSYVSYIGTNGCEGNSCLGENANYVSENSMGYCGNATHKFMSDGYRIAYVKDDSAYLVSAGAVGCANGSELNNIASKYCNSGYAYRGICNNDSVWNFGIDDFKAITKKSISSTSCLSSYSDKTCGYNNDLIDNGGDYWLDSDDSYYWDSSIRAVNNTTSGSYGVRPVIRLDSSVIVTDGTGTYDDPYQIINHSFYVNNGNDYITSETAENVSLKLNGAGVSKMCISVDTSGCSNYIDFSNTYTIDMSELDDGDKTIYVYYKDSDDRLIATMNKKVVLDTVLPTGNSITIGNDTGLTRTLTLRSTGSDYMCFSNTSNKLSDCTNWVEYTTSYSWRLAEEGTLKTVYVFFKDKAGNVASAVSDSIEFSLDCLDLYESYDIDYTGEVAVSSDADVKFCAGTYRFELWGAQGGNNGGKGGYSVGDITLSGNEILYFYVGGAGKKGEAGFNGGGTSGTSGGAGGGATDIRINTDSLYARVIVAGGGGGAGQDSCAIGAYGGGEQGGGASNSGSCGTQAGGGTQTTGGIVGVYQTINGANAGTFGIGGSSLDAAYDGGGGGGGWYGGGAGASAGWSNGGGGGSGFVYSSETSYSVPMGYLLDSTYYLSDAITIPGNYPSIPTTDGMNIETGHSGNGFIKVTRLD